MHLAAPHTVVGGLSAKADTKGGAKRGGGDGSLLSASGEGWRVAMNVPVRGLVVPKRAPSSAGGGGGASTSRRASYVQASLGREIDESCDAFLEHTQRLLSSLRVKRSAGAAGVGRGGNERQRADLEQNRFSAMGA